MTEERDGTALLVLCTKTELQEWGETVRVGEVIRRQAGRREGALYGDELDEIDWVFDQYAQTIGDDAATISGRVTAISAIFVDLEEHPDGWRPRLGSAHLEQVASTADTRVIEDEIVWDVPSRPDRDGMSFRVGHPIIRAGDEHFSGWLITLEDASIAPIPREEV